MRYRIGDRLLGFRVTTLRCRLLYFAVMVAVHTIDRLVFGLRVRGREELGRTPRAILVSNHTLIMDPAVIAGALGPKRTYYTMLEDTALVPWLGTFVRMLGAIPIPARRTVRTELEDAVRTAVNDVGYVHVFPEGECYQWSQILRSFHRGAFDLACRLGLPVIPITTILRQRVPGPLLRTLLPSLRLPPCVTVVIGKAVHPRLEHAPPRIDRRNAAVAAVGRAGLSLLERAEAPSRRREETMRMAETVRRIMQHTIDRSGGCKTIYRGQLPRLVGPHAGAPQQQAGNGLAVSSA